MKRIHIDIRQLQVQGVNVEDTQAWRAELQSQLHNHFADPANLEAISRSRNQGHIRLHHDMPDHADSGKVCASVASAIGRSIRS